ncbi:MAG: hypothetical protein B5M55_05075 [Desulfococcus sp. 4484_242]|nr:MAG: hypothetical protein B5M55_05075 [Desulfococcus sp. 4484_242]
MTRAPCENSIGALVSQFGGRLQQKQTIAVGVDTGGTFTGFVCRKGDSWAVAKLLSSPSNPARAVLEGWRP